MAFKLLNFMLCVTTKDQHLLSFKLLLVIHLEDSLLKVGTQVVDIKMILNPSYSLSTSKPNILFPIISSMLPFALHHMVLYLVVVLIITSLYTTIRIVTPAVMSAVVMYTTSLSVLMAAIQYSLMAIVIFKQLKSKYT